MSRHCCNDCWCLRALLHAACCLRCRVCPSPAQLSSLPPAACWRLIAGCHALQTRLIQSSVGADMLLLDVPILMAASPTSYAMSLFDVGRLSFNLTGLWFVSFTVFLLAWECPVSRDTRDKRLFFSSISSMVHALISSYCSVSTSLPPFCCNSVSTPLPPLVKAVYPLCIHNPLIQVKLTWVAQLDKIEPLESKKSA